MPDIEIIIGLEVHAQVNTRTKMFCSCPNDSFGKPPNTTVCPVCMGHPGTLPVPNKEVIAKAVRASLALHCTVASSSHFDRKHYFYPDLPAGYQISQYDYPLAKHGYVEFTITDASQKCRIHRLHLENDAGKLMHRGRMTLCDYNRAGTPLMEIVTEPDLRSADEAIAFAEELRKILVAVGASEADMFKGMMRFDASISLREKGTEKLNPRSEIKNLNSFKALGRALAYEEARLRKIWEDTGSPLPGDITVGWMDDEGKTRLLRSKESAEDYRYFPEPDIPPLTFTDAYLAEAQAALPLMPEALKARYAAMGLSPADTATLVGEERLRTLFETVTEKTKDPKRAGSIVLTQLVGFLNSHNKSIADAPSAANIVALITAIDDGTISGNAGKEVLEEMVITGKTPAAIISDKGLQQISDSGALEKLVTKALEANPDAVASYKSGKGSALGAIVGWIMKESKGKADPAKLSTMLKKAIVD